MKTIVPAMLMAFLLLACGIEYDGSTKIIFEGRVTGPDGAPLSGIRVSTNLSNGNDRDEISYDHTDSNGHYLMIFPKADDPVTIEVEINDVEVSEALSRSEIVNISFDQAEDYKIDFGTTSLYDAANSVSLQIDTNSVFPVKIGLIGLVADNWIDNNFTVVPQDPVWPLNQTNFTVAPNQVIKLKYLLSDGSVHEREITIGNEDVIYNLE